MFDTGQVRIACLRPLFIRHPHILIPIPPYANNIFAKTFFLARKNMHLKNVCQAQGVRCQTPPGSAHSQPAALRFTPRNPMRSITIIFE